LLARCQTSNLEHHPLLSQCIRSYSTYLEAVYSIRNPRTRHAMVRRTRLIWDITVTLDVDSDHIPGMLVKI